MAALARRNSVKYAGFTEADRRDVRDYALGSRGGLKNRAINTRNEATFELRVFASSLDPVEVQAALGFAAASVEYTRTLSVADIVAGGWGWPAFVSWLRGHPEYAPLIRESDSRVTQDSGEWVQPFYDGNWLGERPMSAVLRDRGMQAEPVAGERRIRGTRQGTDTRVRHRPTSPGRPRPRRHFAAGAPGRFSPLTRSVMFSRPAARPVSGTPWAGSSFGTPW